MCRYTINKKDIKKAAIKRLFFVTIVILVNNKLSSIT